MSNLQQLKGTIESIAQGAKKTGGSLSQFTQTFTQQVAQVQSAIGGSSQRKDQEVIAGLQDAQRKVSEAVKALESAARVASSYGKSL